MRVWWQARCHIREATCHEEEACPGDGCLVVVAGASGARWRRRQRNARGVWPIFQHGGWPVGEQVNGENQTCDHPAALLSCRPPRDVKPQGHSRSQAGC